VNSGVRLEPFEFAYLGTKETMISPSSEAALVDVIMGADAPFRVQGGGTRPVGRPVEGAVLSSAAIAGIELYEPGAMTLVAKAGTPVAEIEKLLDGENQRLAFEPMDHRVLLGTNGEPTIGGVVAGNVSGPRRMQVGACRDHLLGVRFVDGSGEVISNGGRVMKNVTGYDLVKLMAGSRGTLGVLTQVSLKVMPKAEAVATVRVPGAGIEAMTRAMSSPFDVSGAGLAAGDAYLRIEGFEKSVAYRAEQLMSLVGGNLVKSDIWEQIRDVTALKDHTCVWRVCLRPSAVQTILDQMSDKVVVDWAGGCLWIGAGEEGALALHQKLQDMANGAGHATLIKAPDSLRTEVSVFQPEVAPLAAISEGLRAKFDPRGILNPGLMA